MQTWPHNIRQQWPLLVVRTDCKLEILSQGPRRAVENATGLSIFDIMKRRFNNLKHSSRGSCGRNYASIRAVFVELLQQTWSDLYNMEWQSDNNRWGQSAIVLTYRNNMILGNVLDAVRFWSPVILREFALHYGVIYLTANILVMSTKMIQVTTMACKHDHIT